MCRVNCILSLANVCGGIKLNKGSQFAEVSGTNPKSYKNYLETSGQYTPITPVKKGQASI